MELPGNAQLSKACSASTMKLFFIDLKIGDYSKSRGTEYLFDPNNQAARF